MKMTKKICSLLLVLTVLTAAVLSGCTGPDTGEQSSLSLVIGAHKYNPKFTVSTELSDTIYSVARTFGSVSVTVSSGKPATVANWSLDVERKDVGDAKLRQIAKANTEVIVGEIAQLAADSPEVDTLAAISQAANNLSQVDSPVKMLVIYDSGLSTTGYLDFTKPKLILSDVDSIVAQLSDMHAIPDLSGMDVVWYGAGQVRGAQQRPDSDNLYRLKTLWSEILSAGKPASLKFVDAELTADYEDGALPEVSLVDLPSGELELTAEEPAPKVFLQLTDEKLGFKPDTAEFSDEGAASEILDKVVEILNGSDGSDVYVIGSTATFGPHDSSITLSEQRAEKVKSELVDRGAGVSIISAGIGDTPCGLRTDDVDGSGNLIESQAKQNRAVFIISSTSDTIADLKSGGLL